jgi:hypothetical protein
MVSCRAIDNPIRRSHISHMWWISRAPVLSFVVTEVEIPLDRSPYVITRIDSSQLALVNQSCRRAYY